MKSDQPTDHSPDHYHNTLKQGVLTHGSTLEISLFSAQAKKIFFQLFSPGTRGPVQKILLTKDKDHLWRGSLPLPDPNSQYSYLIDDIEVVDPFAKAINTTHLWFQPQQARKGQLTFDHTFDWQGVGPPVFKNEEMIVYEMHVRGFTQDPTSQVKAPGTYLGLIEKIPYLKTLGVNTVELMPIFEFDECENPRTNPKTGQKLCNYWGYNSTSFFCPMKRYATSSDRLAAIAELKTLIRELHRAGMKILLDVVYNHVSYEMQLEMIDKKSYFIVTPEGEHTNYTGCGNTIHANSPASLSLLLSSLRYFAEEFHVDGFRFDLGGALTRGDEGQILSPTPFYKALAHDPILSKKFITAEPWDAGGLNLIGHLGNEHISEWNGEYKYLVRRFINHETKDANPFSYAVHGLQDLYKDRKPFRQQVHYVTTHDGFSLHDLVSYSSKNNEENGEENRDGEGYNISNNWGAEGATENRDILEERFKVMKNFHLANLTSKGIPMITMGDEYGLSHGGNNNPYCHDGPINWFNWDMCAQNLKALQFFQALCSLRKEYVLKAKKVMVIDIQDGILVLSYDNRMLTAYNMNGVPYHLGFLLSGKWRVALATYKTASFVIPPNAAVILLHEEVI